MTFNPVPQDMMSPLAVWGGIWVWGQDGQVVPQKCRKVHSLRMAIYGMRDDAVDSLWHFMFRETLTFMMENPKTITRSIYSIMVARYLERSGDHACRMAENVHYMVTGERIEIR